MKILLDTCVWGGVKQELLAAGHDVLWMGDLPQDPGDSEILIPDIPKSSAFDPPHSPHTHNISPQVFLRDEYKKTSAQPSRIPVDNADANTP
ncbi:MAG: hypothetical protein HC904_02490 [Blastochloris sp.]|nr:hypothetical protein [Blastochloris sp.]